MKQHLNTLFVTTQGAYLAKDGEAVAVRVEEEGKRVVKLRVPVHNLGGIVCFGRIGLSPALMGHCAERGVSLTLMSEHGRLRASVTGFTGGNVLLRRQQYRAADEPAATAAISRMFISGKVANCRQVLLRHLRDNPGAAGEEQVRDAAVRLGIIGREVATEEDLDRLRGLEGEASAAYFGIFQWLVVQQREDFSFPGRSRRPPMDRLNALLSFLYSMLVNDARSAAEACGLDSQVGFLHRDRPGRPSLALDLMEELRPTLCDRLALSLVNRRQFAADDFTIAGTGAVKMTDQARKQLLVAYQKRKQETLTHPFLDERVSLGLIVHLQARLLARHLRGDLDGYPPFIWR